MSYKHLASIQKARKSQGYEPSLVYSVEISPRKKRYHNHLAFFKTIWLLFSFFYSFFFLFKTQIDETFSITLSTLSSLQRPKVKDCLMFSWVLGFCADPCRPRTCADHVFFIYFLINFEIRTLRGPFMRGPLLNNEVI